MEITRFKTERRALECHKATKIYTYNSRENDDHSIQWSRQHNTIKLEFAMKHANIPLARYNTRPAASHARNPSETASPRKRRATLKLSNPHAAAHPFSRTFVALAAERSRAERGLPYEWFSSDLAALPEAVVGMLWLTAEWHNCCGSYLAKARSERGTTTCNQERNRRGRSRGHEHNHPLGPSAAQGLASRRSLARCLADDEAEAADADPSC
mmetsp:Transcript_52894/g.140976  ORF Transcript_52894/g.140976 Transcript_52894/m.140976 type:complete len:212 (-) Transcript_52894:50-685(-)